MSSDYSFNELIDRLGENSELPLHIIDQLYNRILQVKRNKYTAYAEIPSNYDFYIYDDRDHTNNDFEHLRTYIPYLLSNYYIMETNRRTNWCLFPLVKTKRDGEIIMPLDYRCLNAVTEKDNYQLTPYRDIVAEMYKYSIYSKFPIKGGFYGIPLSPESREKTTFYVDGQQYMFRVLPMGYMNGHIIFQRTLDSILSEEIGKGNCLVDAVDIYVFGDDPFWHYDSVMAVVFELSGEGIEVDWDNTELAHRSTYYCSG